MTPRHTVYSVSPTYADMHGIRVHILPDTSSHICTPMYTSPADGFTVSLLYRRDTLTGTHIHVYSVSVFRVCIYRYTVSVSFLSAYTSVECECLSSLYMQVCSVSHSFIYADMHGVRVEGFCVYTCKRTSGQLQGVAVCCSVLQYVAVCCSVLQCVHVL